jgi:Terminase small subunit
MSRTTQAVRRGTRRIHLVNPSHVSLAENLTKPGIVRAIEAAMAARAARLRISQDRALDELSTLAFSDIGHYVVDDKGVVHLSAGAPPTAMAAVASVKRKITTRGTGKWKRTEQEVEIRLWDKPSTLKMAGQHVGLFSNRIAVTGRDGGALEVAAIRAMSTEDLIASTKRLLAEVEEQTGG